MCPYWYFTLYGIVAAIQATNSHPVRTPAAGHGPPLRALPSDPLLWCFVTY